MVKMKVRPRMYRPRPRRRAHQHRARRPGVRAGGAAARAEGRGPGGHGHAGERQAPARQRARRRLPPARGAAAERERNAAARGGGGVRGWQHAAHARRRRGRGGHHLRAGQVRPPALHRHSSPSTVTVHPPPSQFTLHRHSPPTTVTVHPLPSQFTCYRDSFTRLFLELSPRRGGHHGREHAGLIQFRWSSGPAYREKHATVVRDPDHEFDFRGCSDGTATVDTFNASLTATAMNGATCTADGIDLDGTNDYVNLTSWSFGGALTIETYVKWDTLTTAYARIVFFANGGNTDSVIVSHGTSGTARFHGELLLINQLSAKVLTS